MSDSVAARKLDLSPTSFTIVGIHLVLPMLFSTNGTTSPLGIYPLLLVIGGFAFSIFSLLDLNSFFGVLPAYRGIRSTGMYRYVRHPAYASYLFSSLGVCLSLFSERNVLIFLCYLLFTALRINLEEVLLLSMNGEYLNYRNKVRYRHFARSLLMSQKIILAIVATVTTLYLARSIVFRGATAEFSEINVYRKATYALPESFDPINALSTADSALSNLMYDGLFTVDETLKIVPSLVSSWEVSSDGKIYDLQIDSKRFFQDGKNLTVDDVIASLEKLRSSSSPVKETFKRMKDIRKTNDFSIQIELESPYPPFVALLAAPTAKVSRPVPGSPYHIGTGPFRFLGFSKVDGHKVLTLERSENSNSASKEPKIKKLELWELSEAEALDLVQTGKIHDTAIYTSKKVLPMLGDIVVQTSAPSAVTWVIGINTKKPYLADKSIRRCLNSAFEKEDFIRKFIPHQAPAKGMLPPTLSGFSELADLDNSSKAECKNKIGSINLTLEFPQELDDGAQMCEFIKSNFLQIGVTLICKSAQFSNLLEGIISKKADLSLLAMTLDLPDVEYFLNTFESTAAFNLSSYSSKQIDDNLRLARLEQDRQKRSLYFQKINEEIYQNDVTINISYPRHISYRHSCIENFRIGLAGDAYINYDTISLKPFCTHRDNFL